ncbi:MAG: phosphate acyltransferase PlsX [Puniceicoccales bacterium]|jgi:glycerol-3-phosphate acyltransferase PlsX|nr:phosphate acyltransferase PlsX [Puniceicoccales bacterium]
MNAIARAIAIDVMGSDLGPKEIITGVIVALADRKDFRVILIGDEDTIRKNLRTQNLENSSRIEIVHASEVIAMDEKPLQALRTKKDASVVRAIELLRSGKADVMLSCGNTGSLMAGSTLKLRPMPGVERPTLATVIPTLNNYIVMTDVGANPNTTPLQMMHNAILGSDYCSRVLGIEKPRVGLLTIGTEEGKGNEKALAAHELLKSIGKIINYSGLIEGFQIFEGRVDLVVCDGFVGNILLKTLESLVIQLKGYIRNEFKANPMRMLGALLSQGVFKSLKQRLNPDMYGAASLLGLNGMVLKSHGSSNARAIESAVGMAVSVAQGETRENCLEKIMHANGIYEASIAVNTAL